MPNRRNVVQGFLALSGAFMASSTSIRAAQRKSLLNPINGETMIQRLEDVTEISRLQRAFGYYFDRADWPSMAALFASDGEFAIGASGTYVGTARIAAYLKHANGGKDGLHQGQMNETFILQPLIALSGDRKTAQARWRIFGLRGQYDVSASWLEAALHAEYVRDGNGWKIARLWIEERLAVDYVGGWGRNALDQNMTGKDATFAPDKATAPTIPPFASAPAPLLQQDSTEEHHPLTVRLSAAIDVENVINHYGYLTDNAEWDAASLLFASSASADYGPRGGYKGRARIRQMFAMFGAQGLPQDQIANRMQVQPVIHVSDDGQSAVARTRSIMQLSGKGATLFGDSVNEFHFSRADGSWQIDKMTIWPTFLSDLNKGLVDGILPFPGPSEDLPPDSPPIMTSEDPLKAFLPPFHYPNPASGEAMGRIAAGTITSEMPSWATTETTPDRVAQLADLKSLENLQRTYGYLVDKALWRDTADLFAMDGTLEIGGRGVFAGRERIYEYFKFLGPEGPLTGRLINHLQLQPIFTISTDGKTARGRMRFVAEGGDRREIEEREADSLGVPAISVSYLGMGIYENEYVKEDGVWRIAKLHAFFRMYTLDNLGWAKQAMPLTTLEPTLPPDGPQSISYSIYPDVYIAPLHFPHPVTGAKD